jgi:hypothetical protein
MKARYLFIIAGVITILLLAGGIAGAFPDLSPASPAVVAAPVSSGISYQGRLTSPGGSPLNGSFTMRFVVYDDEVAGSALWDSGNMNVTVENGLFNVQLGVDQSDFDGQELWLNIIVDGQTLSPRQEILPAPYALSLRPGADIVGDSISAADATLAGYAPATGTALYADANGGAGLFGDSENNYGVWGSSNNSWGGYFTSSGGYGIRVNTDGNAHYDHGAYITSDGGYGVYAQSANNQAVRGEAGDMTNITTAFGRVGVVGMGENRGVHGASNNALGVYGTSSNSTGVYGNTSRADRNYGLYTNDNLFSFNINIAGAVMQVMKNGGTEPLSPGDVVVFSGIDHSETAVEGPVVQVSKANVANSTAVAGVVFSRFNIDAIDPDLESPDNFTQEALGTMEITPAGNASTGEHILVVVQGPAQVKASALGSNSIQPGDLLSTSSTAGLAGKAAMVTMDGVETAVPGTVFAKALEPVSEKQEMVYVYVTLQ